MYYDSSKPEKTMRERIQSALKLGTAYGQLDLGRRVLGQNYSLDDWARFTETLRSMLLDPIEVVENKIDRGGYFEYTYQALPEVKR